MVNFVLYINFKHEVENDTECEYDKTLTLFEILLYSFKLFSTLKQKNVFSYK